MLVRRRCLQRDRRIAGKHHDVPAAGVSIEVQCHPRPAIDVLEAIGIRLAIDQHRCRRLPDEPDRIGLRSAVSRDGNDPNDLLCFEPVGDAPTEC